MPTWVITGADRGIGYEFVRTLAEDPENLVISLVLNKKETEAQILEHGVKGVHVFEADVRNRSALLKAAEDVEKVTNGKGVDVLINNAGLVAKPTAFRTLEEYYERLDAFDQDLSDCYNINVIGTINATAAFIPLLKKGTIKKVIALSSGMGDLDWTTSLDMDMAVPYSISKAALNMVMAKFSASYKKDGILFMSVSPGAVDSEDDGRGTNPPVEDVDVSARELEKRKEQGLKFNQYERTYTKPLNTQESVQFLLKLLPQKSIENGDAGAYISHTGTKRWL